MKRDGAKMGSEGKGCIGSKKIILYGIIRRRKVLWTLDDGVEAGGQSVYMKY